MLTARRMRERQEAEATGVPPSPPRPRRTEIPWHEHEGALAALETRLRSELVVAPERHTVELSFDEEPFKSAVEALVAELEARFAEVTTGLKAELDEALKRGAELEAEVAELTELLEQATAEDPAEGVQVEVPAGTEPVLPPVEPTVTPPTSERLPATEDLKGSVETKPKGPKPKAR